MCPGQDYDDSFAISQTKPADNAVFYVNAHRLDDTPSSASHHTHQPVKPSLLGAGWGQNLGFMYLAINPNDTQVPDRGMSPRPRIRFSFTTVYELTHGVRKRASLASGYVRCARTGSVSRSSPRLIFVFPYTIGQFIQHLQGNVNNSPRGISR